VKDTAVKVPAEMIALGDVRSDVPSGSIVFNANLHVTAVNSPYPHWPCNRHNFRTDLLFCDGHVENPRRNDVIDPNQNLWRSRWNNDHNPHTELPTWSIANDNATEQ
jgi:prepilin-type processing-associated H-X9-DG protein